MHERRLQLVFAARLCVGRGNGDDGRDHQESAQPCVRAHREESQPARPWLPLDAEAYTSRRSLLQCRRVRAAVVLVLVLLPAVAAAQPGVDPSEWKQLSIEELLDIDITTAMRMPSRTPKNTTPAVATMESQNDVLRMSR